MKIAKAMKTQRTFSLRFRRGPALCLAALLAWAQGNSAPAAVDARIKDIARIEGLYGEQLIGYGVVVGLAGTGDKNLELTKQTVANLLKQFNINIPATDIKSKNVAAVMITATAPVFHRKGDRVDVQVSTMGDATSLESGVLLMTPLMNAAGDLSALAQGPLTVSGYSVGVGGMGGEMQTKNFTSVATIPNGALLRNTQEPTFIQEGLIRLSLNHADFTTANRVADVINAKYEGVASAQDGGVVLVRIPESLLEVGQASRFISELELLRVQPDTTSKIVVNERSGTIVMGGEVKIGEAVVAHGNLTVRISSSLATYMPNSFTDARPVTTPEVDTRVNEQPAKIMLIPGTTSVQELAEMLNQVGTTPRDIIAILEALQQLGALQMEIETM